MTTNQLKWAELQETKRSHLTNEAQGWEDVATRKSQAGAAHRQAGAAETNAAANYMQAQSARMKLPYEMNYLTTQSANQTAQSGKHSAETEMIYGTMDAKITQAEKQNLLLDKQIEHTDMSTWATRIGAATNVANSAVNAAAAPLRMFRINLDSGYATPSATGNTNQLLNDPKAREIFGY